MQFAFCLFKYFPYGGIQRDGYRIAQALVAKGHRVRFYALAWEGELPDWIDFVRVPVKGVTRHTLYARYQDWVQQHLNEHPVQLVFGLNKMTGLDAYFAGDSCFEEKARTQRGWWYRHMPRYRFFAATERAVFRRLGATQILTISDVQTPFFQRYYRTPNARLHALPPGIDPSRIAPPNAAEIGAGLREEFAVPANENLLLFVGSGFKKKGLDRVLRSLASLEPQLLATTRLFVLGADNFDPFERMAKRLGVAGRVRFFSGRDDVPRFFFAADLLLLPAYDENTGTVILESMVAGLPVLTTANCGYAVWVERFDAGRVVADPFEQAALDDALRGMLVVDDLEATGLAAERVAAEREIFSLVPTATTLLEGFAKARRNGVIVFCLFKYFPFGGLQRDFLRIAEGCAARGYGIRVYTLSWEGSVPEGFDVILVPDRGLSNHVRYAHYIDWVQRELARVPPSLVVGFNKMPGLDVYFAADACFEAKAQTMRGGLYRYTPRYRFFAKAEREVFASTGAAQVLLLTERQRDDFVRFYATNEQRLTVLPPGVNRDRLPDPDPLHSREVQASVRTEFGLQAEDRLLLAIGSGFATKGLDRTLLALASLPDEVRHAVQLIVVGQDDPALYLRMAQRIGVVDNVRFLGGRDDVPRFLQAADLLLHPAYAESGGIVLLEALINGLPVLASEVCGYADYLSRSDAGELLPEPFVQSHYNERLLALLDDPERLARFSANGLRYGRQADIFDLQERAVALIVAAASKQEPAEADG